MSKVIDLSKGYDSLSEQDKLYLAARGKLPKEHISDSLRAALDISGAPSTVAYGAHTGTVATMTDDELEKELERRRASAESAYKGDDPKKALMPGLENPHSERLDAVKENHEQAASEANKRHAAAQAAGAGPVVPSLGAPGVTQRTEVPQGTVSSDDDDDDEEDGLDPEDYADADTSTTNKELRGEIVRRNAARQAAGLEPLELDGNKATLVAALQQDDEERADDDEE
jgi:hypothetical protein